MQPASRYRPIRTRSFLSTAASQLSRLLPFFLAGLFLAGGLALPGSVQGQITPQSINQPCTACEPQAIHVADLNGDGDPDVLSVSQFDDKLAWYENTGGGYGQQQVISTSLTSSGSSSDQSVYAADLDGDNDLDVIAGSGPDEKAVWFENQIGEGGDSDGFGPAQQITTSNGKVFAVTAAKIDGDKKADVVLGTGGSGVIWFESKIGESGDDFSTANTINSSSLDPKALVLADVSGDSNPDVLYGGLNEIAWHENTGSSFGGKNTIESNILGANSIAAGDVDDDNELDLIAASSTDGEMLWYENTDGNGTFGSGTVIKSGSLFESVAAADVDGDGDEDVFAAIQNTTGDDRVSWFESQGSGFGTEQVITTSLLSPEDVATANVDGGSDVELLVTSKLDDKVAWFENTGGGYGSPQPVNVWPDAILPRSVVATPIDTDADADVLVASQTDGKVSWYENTDGAGSFSAQQVISVDARRPQEAIAADLNNDTKPDAVVASEGGSQTGMLAWYENQTGEGGADSDGFGPEQIIVEPGDVQQVEAADLDGDTDKDLVVVYGSFSQNVVWYENQIDEGSGFSTENSIASSLFNLRAMRVADLNGGGADVIIGYQSFPSTLSWFENDGNGNFSGEKVIDSDVGGQINDLTSASLDSDTDQDLLLASAKSGGDGIVWYPNQLGEGGDDFGGQNVISTAVQFPQSVYAADLTGDSNVDVLSASTGGDKVAWYANEGGAFSSQTVVYTSSKGNVSQGAESVFAADINGDTETDVLSVSTGREEVAWYENTSGVLPVEMAGFDASIDDASVQLSWTTASETNNAGFRIQRRVGEGEKGREGAWTRVGSVEGAGTTSEVQNYRFTDADLPYEADALTYRLKQVDIDGTVHFSETVTVERGVEKVRLLGTAPNPVRQQAKVRYALPQRQDVTVQLYDVLGRQVRTVVSEPKEGRHKQSLDVSGLSSGVYFLRLQSNGQVRTQKLTVVQ